MAAWRNGRKKTSSDDSAPAAGRLRRILVERRRTDDDDSSNTLDLLDDDADRLAGTFTVHQPSSPTPAAPPSLDGVVAGSAPVSANPDTFAAQPPPAPTGVPPLITEPAPRPETVIPDLRFEPDTRLEPPRVETSFPGGRARLPRLDGSDADRLSVVGSAFVRPHHEPDTVSDRPPNKGGFEEYFTYESLFDPEAPEAEQADERRDPYKILGVKQTAEWDDIQAAHRRLVKEFHPDRFVGHDEETIRRAETEIRRITWAYSQLQDLHTRHESDELSAT